MFVFKLSIYLLCLNIQSGFTVRKQLVKYNRKKILKDHNLFSDEAFHGVWKIKTKDDLLSNEEIVNICPNGKLEVPSSIHMKLNGVWYTKGSDITLVMIDNNSSISYIYYGETNQNNISIHGHILYGSESPDYLGSFRMDPIFPLFHNITEKNKTSRVTVDTNNMTGKWLFENTCTKSVHLLNLHKNYTWDSFHYTNEKSILGGIWNLYDSSEDLDLTTGIHRKGDYIWLLAEKLGSKSQNRLNLISNILYLGKITHLGKLYLQSDESPSSEESKIEIIASTVNGTVYYGYEDEPEISESFYMKRWWNS